MRELDLNSFCKLTSLKGLENLTDLEILEISGCKYFDNISQISSLKNLKKIQIYNCGNIDSIEPLRNLKKLEEVNLISDTIISDGDMSLLYDLPNLKKVDYSNYKTYKPSQKEFHENWVPNN